MSPKSFVVLLAVTAGSVGLAAYAILERNVPSTAGVVGAPLAPALADRLEEVGKLVVERQGQTTTIERRDGQWVLVERGGYPVEPARVRDLVLAVSNARLLEPKTSNPDRLQRLELAAPSSPDARSTLLRILSAGGDELAALVIGKTKYGLYGAGRGGVYVREASSGQAWLADRAIELPDEPVAWLDRTVVDVPRDAVTGITLNPEGGDALELVAAGGDGGGLTLATVPEGREVDPEKVARIVSLLSGLSMQDVRPAAEMELSAQPRRATFRLANGAAVEIAATRVGEGDEAAWWAGFTVSAAAPAALPASAPSATPPTAAESGTVEPASAAATDDPKSGPSEQLATPEELKRKLEGWAFKLPSYLAERLGWRAEDFLKPADKTS